DFFAFRAALPGGVNAERGRRFARAYVRRREFAGQADFVQGVLADCERRITEAAHAASSLGFGEILRALRDLLRDRPDMAEEIGRSADALLVDEFQDTSRLQREVVALLWARKGTRLRGKIPSLGDLRESGLLVVGDRKQSIYG